MKNSFSDPQAQCHSRNAIGASAGHRHSNICDLLCLWLGYALVAHCVNAVRYLLLDKIKYFELYDILSGVLTKYNQLFDWSIRTRFRPVAFQFSIDSGMFVSFDINSDPCDQRYRYLK